MIPGRCSSTTGAACSPPEAEEESMQPRHLNCPLSDGTPGRLTGPGSRATLADLLHTMKEEALSYPLGVCPFHLSCRGQGQGRVSELDKKYCRKLTASYCFTRTRCKHVPKKTEAKGYKNRLLPSGTMTFYWPSCPYSRVHKLKKPGRLNAGHWKCARNRASC